ncbi:MAG: hypothetical protein V5A37_05905, partial [Halobacteriales archaeon]
MGSSEPLVRRDARGRPLRLVRTVGPRPLLAGAALLAAAAPFLARVLVNARVAGTATLAPHLGLLSAGALAVPAVAAGGL